MTVDVFRDAVVYDVGTLEEGGGVERRDEGVVNENEGFGWVGFGEADHSRDIYQPKGGVRGGLDPHDFGIRAERSEDGIVVVVLEVHIRTCEALVLARNTLDVPVGSTVDVIDAEEVSVRPKGAKHHGGGCRPRSKSEAVGSSLDGSKSSL